METIFILNLLVILLLGATYISATYIYIRRMKGQLKNAQAKISRYCKANEECNPLYFVGKLNDTIDDFPEEYFGKYVVVRTTLVNGYIHEALIKVFTDNDDEFNKREAFELCEILNSK